MIGRTLSHYQILEKLGSGGMGEVYLAHDTKLSRDVALKVLPAEMADNEERRSRFEREAKAVAALNHPNIVTIYSVEESEDVHFYTMEYVKGKTLSEMIPSKGMPLNNLFEIAIPLSDAVSTAHERGITHRDLKPDNIMVGEDRRLKILDFGLAKLKQELVQAGASELPTATATQEGRILGTVAYMSPEQAEGKTIDHRSDIFSLGIILYEMATGRRPFQGDTTASILSSILKDTPDSVTEVNPSLPRDLGKIIKRCLVKDTERRYQTAKDVRNELEELKQDVDSGEVLESARARPAVRTPVAVKWLLAAVGVIAISIVAYLVMRPGPETPETSGLPQGEFTRITSQPGVERFPSLSPDGTHIVYASKESGNWDIYLKRVGGERVINLTENSPADDTMPAYSPDGNLIAFRSERDGGGIFIMGATGESVRRLTDFGYLPSWSPDGSRIVMATEGVTLSGMHMVASQLWIVDVNTQDREYLTDGRRPHWSPNGHRIAYDEYLTLQVESIWTISADGGDPVRVTPGNLNPVWSPDGKSLLFSTLGQNIFTSNLAKMPINEKTGEALGELEPLTFGPEEFRFDITVSRDGKQIAFTEYLRRMNVYRYDFDPSRESTQGEPIPITRGARRTNFVDCSPDGQHLVFSQNDDIVISGVDGSGARMLFEGPNTDRQPRWSPDGSKIAFRSEYRIWFINPDGSGLEQIDTPQDQGDQFYPFWSPDGSYLVYFVLTQGSFIKALTEASTEEPTPQIVAYEEEGSFFVAWSWSPDGNRLAGYHRREDGVNAGIVIYDFETQEYERLTEFGRNPEWLADSRRLLFIGETESGIYLVDSETKDWKQIAPEGRTTCPLSPDNRSIYTHIPTAEADIWLLTLSQ